MSNRSKLWLAAVAGALAVMILAALVLPQSFGLMALSDLVQCVLLISGTASFIPLALRSQGRMRFFWSLITLGLALWLFYQFLWTYYEVILRRDVPDLFTGDVVLFLHLVPLMAALALRPHIPRDEYAARLGRLDFALLIVWWFYLYVLIVMPWQFAVPYLPIYSRNLNAVYLAEKAAFLAALAASWIASKNHWRKLYASLFAANLVYAAGSYVANWAIERGLYYSGSFYDIPLAASMAWLTWIGLRTNAQEPEHDARAVSTAYGVWIARCSMIAVFSLPLFAAWALAAANAPTRVRLFRLALTLVAAFVMGAMVFVRQYLLDRELIQILNYSHESFDKLKRLQVQLLQSEKLASIGQLVGGAAHELNNPITAMLGYSDLLLSTRLNAQQEPLAVKIGQHVRRTKSLVASLISFARQGPGSKTPVDLNTLARTAVKLTQPQWQALKIEVSTSLEAELPKVLGDSNQLLQVCLQLIGNCLHNMSEQGQGVLIVGTRRQDGISVLEITTEASRNESSHLPSTHADSDDDLALSACRGILQEHHGHLSRECNARGGTVLRVELPAVESAPAKAKSATAPGLWQSQPFA